MKTGFKTYLVYLRKKQTETNVEMAAKLRVLPTTLANYESGRRTVPKGWAEKIAVAYSLDLKEQRKLTELIDEANALIKVDKGFSDKTPELSIGSRVLVKKYQWQTSKYKDIVGTVFKVYENTAIVDVDEGQFKPIDYSECNHRIVVSFKELKMVA